jgi:hypothetical protein
MMLEGMILAIHCEEGVPYCPCGAALKGTAERIFD